MEGRLLRLGEELAKTFRPKLRTHAAAAPQRTAARDSALPLAPPPPPPHARSLLPTAPCSPSLLLASCYLTRSQRSHISFALTLTQPMNVIPILNKFLNCSAT